MNATAYTIADMAQTITYEALRFPDTEAVALAWLRRAVAWAQARGLSSLMREVQTCIFRIEIQPGLPTEGEPEGFTFEMGCPDDADILELRPEQIAASMAPRPLAQITER